MPARYVEKAVGIMAGVALAASLAACSGSSGGSTSVDGLQSAKAALNALPTCEDMTAIGTTAKLKDVEAGCRQHDGTIYVTTAIRCVVSVDADDLNRWAKIGGEWQDASGPVAEDPGYAAAYDAC